MSGRKKSLAGAGRRFCDLFDRDFGQLLAKMEKNKGGRPAKNPSPGTSSLADLGVSHDQSSRWQALAGVLGSMLPYLSKGYLLVREWRKCWLKLVSI